VVCREPVLAGPICADVPEESLLAAVDRTLSPHGVDTVAIWAVEHAYTIYNRRFDEVQVISVFAAEVARPQAVRLAPGHAEFGWFTATECEQRLSFKGLKDGLKSLREYISEVDSPGPEFKLR
jgi:hypothetical protein